MRCAVALLILCNLVHAADTKEREAPPKDAMKWYIPDQPGWFQWRPMPGPKADPVAALAPEDDAWLAKPPTGGQLDAAVAGFMDRQADRVAALAGPKHAELLAWLAEPAQRSVGKLKVDLRRELLLACEWRFDRLDDVLAVMDRLRRERPEAVAAMPHLAIAIAVVYDDDNKLFGSRYHGIWGWKAPQFAKVVDPVEVIDHFADPKVQGALVFKPAALVWPMLVHVVDLDTTAEERAWAVASRAKEAKDPAQWYPMCPYDNDKLGGRTPRLGSQPFTLPNLLQYGGVCGDQAHFMSRIAKALGIPAMKCSGESRWGGIGHCWSGYLTAQGGVPTLSFTGRYQYDNYYTGDVFDPQTGREILDRYVHLLYDAVASNPKRGTSYPRWTEARALARAGLAIESSAPERSAQLAVLAVGRNPCHADAWRLAFRHVAAKRIDDKEAKRLAKVMLEALADHPDLTVDLLDDYLTTIPVDQRAQRDALYAGLWKLYAKRPDLQIRVRQKHCEELVAAQQEPKALLLALECVVANAAEGTLILPLVEYVVATSKVYAASNPKFNVAVLRKQMDEAAKVFPKARGSTVSPAWTEFQRLIAGLP